MASAFSAALVGIGLARFAYTPLIPALIAAGWFSPSDAVYLGAANLAGYLAGAVLARSLAARFGTAMALRSMMLLASAAFFACAMPIAFSWFFLWRLLAGISGGALMVLAGPAVMPLVPQNRRGFAGGIVFTGVGLGIAASGTLVPALLQGGIAFTWCGLGALALLLTAVGWGGWPAGRADTAAAAPAPGRTHRLLPGLAALLALYGLDAVGLVPHMVFLVDFIARGLDRGLEQGAWFWVLFGGGATLGPVLAGRLADAFGFRAALRLALVLQAVAVALPLLGDSVSLLGLSCFVVGAFVPGVVPLVLGRVQELAPEPAAWQGAWSLATIAFALGQAMGAYGFAALFAVTGSHILLFALAAGAMVMALLIDCVGGWAPVPWRRRSEA